MDELFETLGRRMRPEDVAQMLVEQLARDLTPGQFECLDKAAAHSLKREFGLLTSMSEDFFDAAPPLSQAATARELFKSAVALTAAQCADVATLRGFVAQLSAEIRMIAGHSSFKYDRLGRKERRAGGLDLSKRRYNKLFRFLARFEAKIARYAKELKRAELRRVAKSGLAARISRADFAAAGPAAPFVAYMAARLNRRSAFTNVGQDRAYDEIAAMLFERFVRAPNRPKVGWRIIARVMPDRVVVNNLADEDKMALFAEWLAMLKSIAEALRECWSQNKLDRATMIVARGQDSSTWNAAAGAWNVARQGWLGALHAMGMEDVVDLVCLGKAMRLMAADVARWHQSGGGGLHPDTAVWAALPAPWEVLAGEAACTRVDVEAACAKYGVDPLTSGWTTLRNGRTAAPFKPTPELVHGVEVSHPELAGMLRKAGWFSGKPTRPLPEGVEVAVARDKDGFALGAKLSLDTNRPGLWARLRRWAAGEAGAPPAI